MSGPFNDDDDFAKSVRLKRDGKLATPVRWLKNGRLMCRIETLLAGEHHTHWAAYKPEDIDGGEEAIAAAMDEPLPSAIDASRDELGLP